MRKRERHYRTVLALYALRYEEELQAGYESALRVKRMPAGFDLDPWRFFTGARFCKEDYEHLRSTLGESPAFCIGWAVALEELRDCSSPAHTLAELFMTEKCT